MEPSPATLPTTEFLTQVLNSRPAVAVFDCDGTLWSRDAGVLFLNWSLEQGMVSRETTDWILGRYSLYKRGEVSEQEICGEMTRMYAGLREQEMRAAAGRFFREHIAPYIFPSMLRLVRQLAEQGTELWAVSSTNTWVIEAGLADFGIAADHVLASRVAVRDGLLTSELIDVPSGPAKRDALIKAGVGMPDAVFGNSVHDAAMLAMAAAPYAVNPTPQLLELAGAERWPVYWPEDSL